jgi:hypothetical protein
VAKVDQPTRIPVPCGALGAAHSVGWKANMWQLHVQLQQCHQAPACVPHAYNTSDELSSQCNHEWHGESQCVNFMLAVTHDVILVYSKT